MEKSILGLEAITIVCMLISVVYISGIVWRVERELDISYKFFLVATVLFLIGVGIDVMFPIQGGIWEFISKASIMLFSVLFLFGVWRMRDMVRHLDGEK